MTSDRRRRILHLRSSSELLGAEQVILSLCAKSPDYGYDTALAVLQDRGESPPAILSAARERGIEAHAIACAFRLDPAPILSLRRLVARYSPDVLHCHGYREDFYTVTSGIRAARVTTNHLWKRTSPALRFYAALDARLMRRFDRVVAVSGEIHREHLSAGLDPARLALIPNGLDAAELKSAMDSPDIARQHRQSLGIDSNSIVLVTISSLTPEKGHEYLMRALAGAALDGIAPTLLVVGDGPLAGQLKSLARELAIQDRVKFLGRRSDVARILSLADIFVLPSLNEGLPIALLEAMASGTACIATAVGDVATLIRDGQTGLLVESGSSDALAGAVGRLTKDSGLRATLAAAGAELVAREFSSEKMTEAYCRLYDEIVR